MGLTSQNTEMGHVGRALRSILTEIETRKVSGEPVPPVPTHEKHRTGTQKMTTNDLHREVQEWRNRALLAESRLAVATGRTQAHNPPLANAAGEIEEPLPTPAAEQE